MVAAISDDTSHLSTHCTFLEVGARGVVKIPVDRKDQRRCYGGFRGGTIKLARGVSGKAWRDAPPGDVVLLGEGIEDVLTAAIRLPHSAPRRLSRATTS